MWLRCNPVYSLHPAFGCSVYNYDRRFIKPRMNKGRVVMAEHTTTKRSYNTDKAEAQTARDQQAVRPSPYLREAVQCRFSGMTNPAEQSHITRPPAQRREASANPNSNTLQTASPSNRTGLPDRLKTGIENLSGYAMDDVRVHYNSSKPAQLSALAYTQGANIYVGPRQERHLPHEAWHVVQQKQGRVKPTLQLKNGVNANDDSNLEREADAIGSRLGHGTSIVKSSRSLHLQRAVKHPQLYGIPDDNGLENSFCSRGVVQQQRIYVGVRMKDNVILTTPYGKRPSRTCLPGSKQGDHTTPYTSLESQVANAIEGVTLDEAWDNLMETFMVYKTLPGWEESKVFVKRDSANHLEASLNTKGDLAALRLATQRMLELRNQIELTSLPNGGSGNAEGTWAGSLQYQERFCQRGNPPSLNKNSVIEFVWKAFEHRRVNNLEQEKRDKIIRQHSITMADAYPQLMKELGIDARQIEDYYPKREWTTYDPEKKRTQGSKKRGVKRSRDSGSEGASAAPAAVPPQKKRRKTKAKIDENDKT